MLGEHESTSGQDNEPPLAHLPLAERIQLAHALIEAVSTEAGVDLLHIKGYAADRRLYAPGRASSDVDVLVRPPHAPLLIDALLSRGWEVATTFESGSLFHHAMTLWSSQWGYVDVHRAFPGVGLEPELFFELLWASRAQRSIAGWPCRVPSFQHQAFVIVLHGARDPYRGAEDVRFVQSAVDPAEWTVIEELAADVDARLGFAAATGRLDEWVGHPEREVWDVVSRGGTRIELFAARWRAARTLGERLRLVRAAVVVNKDHLRMKLLRDPAAPDYALELWSRGIDVVRASLPALRRRNRRG